MSQEGAMGMARAGFTYDQILTHYYTGTKVELKK
jgi:stage II sporulation protein D